MKIYYDENGERTSSPLDDKNEEIKEHLLPVYEKFVEEQENMKFAKRPTKLGYRFSKHLFLQFYKYPRMTTKEFAELDYDTIYEYWLHYLELTAYYNEVFEIVDNKQYFQAYMGINGRQFTELENSDDGEIRDIMNEINSSFIGLGFVATESGNSDSKATGRRLSASGEAGHKVTSATEEKIANVMREMSETEWFDRLESEYGVKVQARIEGKK
jgi:hypothetical protein